MTAELWKRRSVLKSWAISRTNLWKGSFLIRSSVLFWYLLISRRATVPGLYLCGFLTPPVAGALLRAALVASCFLGAFPPVDLRAVCFVRAIVDIQKYVISERIPKNIAWKCFCASRYNWKLTDDWVNQQTRNNLIGWKMTILIGPAKKWFEHNSIHPWLWQLDCFRSSSPPNYGSVTQNNGQTKTKLKTWTNVIWIAYFVIISL